MRFAGLWCGLGLLLGGCAPSIQQQVRLHNQQGVAHLGQGNYPAARCHFEEALRLDPNDFAAIYNLGSLAHRTGEYPLAERCYRACLSQQPTHAASLHGLIRLLAEQNARAEAWQLTGDWSERQPSSADPLVARAWLLRHEGDYTEAERALDMALEREPRHVRALAERAVFLEEVQHYPDRAIALYERVLDIDPSRADVRDRLARLRRGIPAPPRDRP